MRLAHVRERHAPAGTRWRLAAALGDDRWLDLEPARRRAIAARPDASSTIAGLFRQPIATLDDGLRRGLRVAAFGDLVDGFQQRDEDDAAVLDARDISFGAPLLEPRSFRDGYGVEGHVRTMWSRRDAEIPEAWHRLAIFYFSNVSEMRGPGDPVWAPAGSVELDDQLEIGALIDTPARDLHPRARRGRDRRLLDPERLVGAGSAARRVGPPVGPRQGRLRDLHRPVASHAGRVGGRPVGDGFDLVMTATVNGVETSRGRWSDIVHGFAELAARASADVTLRPGELLGSGTVGGGRLLEIRETTLGRYLEPGDEVTLTVERLGGSLTTPIVARPES